MRKSQIITIAGLGEVTVKEVSPLAVYRALSAKNKVEEITGLAVDCLSLSREQLEKLYPSEIEQIIEAVVEVNSAFLTIADRFGLKEPLSAMAREMIENLSRLFVGSYRQVMERMPGIMAGPLS